MKGSTLFIPIVLVLAAVAPADVAAKGSEKDRIVELEWCGTDGLYDPAPGDICCIHELPIEQESVDFRISTNGGFIPITLIGANPNTAITLQLVSTEDEIVWRRIVRSDENGKYSLRKLDWRGPSGKSLKRGRYDLVGWSTEECLSLIVEVTR